MIFSNHLPSFVLDLKFAKRLLTRCTETGSDHCVKRKGSLLQYLPGTSLTENPTPVPGDGFKSKNMTSKLTAPVHKARLCGDNRAAWGTGAG